MAASEGYRVPDVCRVIGISYRQLDYWSRTGLVTPSVRAAGGSGTQRLYSFQDLVLLKVIRKLLDAGISLQRIRKAIVFLRRHMKTQPVGTTLLSDGVSIYACESEDEIIDLVKGGQAVFALALDKVWDDLAGSLPKDDAAAPRAAMAGAGGS